MRANWHTNLWNRCHFCCSICPILNKIHFHMYCQCEPLFHPSGLEGPAKTKFGLSESLESCCGPQIGPWIRSWFLFCFVSIWLHKVVHCAWWRDTKNIHFDRECQWHLSDTSKSNKQSQAGQKKTHQKQMWMLKKDLKILFGRNNLEENCFVFVSKSIAGSACACAL